MAEHRGHKILVDRMGWGDCRNIRVPSLGIDEVVYGTYLWTVAEAQVLIDRHIRLHGNAPVNRDPMTDEERAELYRETFGRF